MWYKNSLWDIVRLEFKAGLSMLLQPGGDLARSSLCPSKPQRGLQLARMKTRVHSAIIWIICILSVLHLSRLRKYLWCVWSVIFPGVRAGILQNGKTIYKMTFWDLKNCTIKLGANQVHLKWMTKMKLVKIQSLQSLPHVEIKLNYWD